jgi:hypothetical protein
MGLFDSKAKRVAQHRELLSLAKDALQRLHIEGYKTRDGGHVPTWKDLDAVPLECRYWLRTYLESLVTWVYDTDEGDLGNREAIAELVESVTAARAVLAGIPDSLRPRLRAHAFMHLQGALSDQVDYLSKGIATDNWILLSGMPERSLERCLSDCKTALTWFPDHKVLHALYAQIKPADVLMLPRPSACEMRRLIDDGEKILVKLHAIAASKSTS